MGEPIIMFVAKKCKSLLNTTISLNNLEWRNTVNFAIKGRAYFRCRINFIHTEIICTEIRLNVCILNVFDCPSF